MTNIYAEFIGYMENQPCDLCDRMGDVAHINTLGNDVLGICKDCLKEIIEEMEK